MMTDSVDNPNGIVWVLAPEDRVGEQICETLNQAGIDCDVSPTMAALCAQIRSESAEAAIVSEEALSADAMRELGETLGDQPDWSDFPVVILTRRGLTTTSAWLTLRDLEHVGYALILDRPLRPLAVVSAVKVALRARRRQRQVQRFMALQNEHEEKLRAAMRREQARNDELQALLDLAPVGIAVAHDVECGQVTINAAGAAILGLPEDQHVTLTEGAVWTQTFRAHREGTEVSPEQWALLRACRDGSTIAGEETEILRHDGSRVTIYEYAVPLFDEQEGIRGALLVFMDISERKRAEQHVRESEAQFRGLVEAMPHIVWTATPDGEVEYLSPRLAEFTGCDAERTSVTGITWSNVLHPQDRGPAQAAWEAAIREGRPMNVEYRIRRADGAFRWFLSKAVPIYDARGQVTKWFGTATDIHDRKMVEQDRKELLRRAQSARVEAERVSRMKDEFLATLSHELRTPLTAILGWIQMVRRGVLAEDEEQEALRTIETNARSQKTLIEDLLEMSRIVSGKVKLSVEETDLTDLVFDAIESFHPAVEAKSITITPTVTTDETTLRADVGRLRQVVWNLLSNAVKFTPRGGQVRVTLERRDDHLHLSVSDSGKGIDPEFLPHVFERFRQLDASTKRQHGGLGLGLAVVKQLVELHGGQVTAESDGPGQGATFRVSLPVVGAPVEAGEPGGNGASCAGDTKADTPAVPLSETKILVVDDEPDARTLIERILRAASARVRTAGTVAEALRHLPSFAPDVVISDLAMPDSDGYDFVTALRQREQPGRRLPAIALTALASAAQREKCLRLGFDRHLTKPVDPDELVQAVVESINARSADAGD